MSVETCQRERGERRREEEVEERKDRTQRVEEEKERDRGGEGEKEETEKWVERERGGVG